MSHLAPELTTVGKQIRIDAPGAGAWIMRRCEGRFSQDTDHSISNWRDGKIAGGFVLSDYTGASMTVHMAGDDEHWCSRDLLWMVFHYAFVQLGCRKLIAPVRSNNYAALAIDLRGGWRIEAIVRDAYPDAHMFLLTMDREHCPWLKIKPKGWIYGPIERGEI
jgi:RimJ/RimL family protein N-acetyltransferase